MQDGSTFVAPQRLASVYKYKLYILLAVYGVYIIQSVLQFNYRIVVRSARLADVETRNESGHLPLCRTQFHTVLICTTPRVPGTCYAIRCVKRKKGHVRKIVQKPMISAYTSRGFFDTTLNVKVKSTQVRAAMAYVEPPGMNPMGTPEHKTDEQTT